MRLVVSVTGKYDLTNPLVEKYFSRHVAILRDVVRDVRRRVVKRISGSVAMNPQFGTKLPRLSTMGGWDGDDSDID